MLSFRKKAVLFGLNYPGTELQLNGCYNDVIIMGRVLVSKFKYQPGQVVIKTDKDLIGDKDVPDFLEEAILNLKKGETLYFHYSGHGLQVTDENGDEKDNLDEAIITRKDNVSDDRFSSILAKAPAGSIVILMFDSCNSGTVCDLPFIWKGGKLTERVSDKIFKADIITISGCKDDQSSADAWINERMSFYGALTWTVQKLINQNIFMYTSFKRFVEVLNADLKRNGYTQNPQICVSSINLLDKPMLL